MGMRKEAGYGGNQRKNKRPASIIISSYYKVEKYLTYASLIRIEEGKGWVCVVLGVLLFAVWFSLSNLCQFSPL